VSRVLIVDDDADQLRLRGQLIAREGHRVATAVNCADAAGLLEAFQPDVLLTDLRLPGIDDGLALIRAAGMRAAPPRIVVLSGWPADLHDLPEARLVARILLKPTPTAVLLEVIRGLAVG
jgi:CheY-like chemotaxis protein